MDAIASNLHNPLSSNTSKNVMSNYKLDIPDFDTTEYGGYPDWPTPEPLHYEPLALRSSAYDWIIKAHRHSSLYQFFLLTQGEVNLQLDDSYQKHEAPALIVIPPMTVHGFEWAQGSDWHVLSILTSAIPDAMPFFEQHLTYLSSAQVLEGDKIAARIDVLSDDFSRIRDEYNSDEPARLQMLQSYVAVLLVKIVRVTSGNQSIRSGQLGEEEMLARKFRQLVDSNFRDHPNNDWLAAKLGISSSRMSQICNRVLGAAPQQILHSRICLEAKRILTYTGQPVAETAYNLGFTDPAYFSRFFKKMTGQSPAAFKRATD